MKLQYPDGTPWNGDRMFAFGVYEEAVRRSYAYSVDQQEFEAKCTPEATQRIAYYFMMTGEDVELFDDTSGESPNKEVQFLYDFLAMTDDQDDEPTLETTYLDVPAWTGTFLDPIPILL